MLLLVPQINTVCAKHAKASLGIYKDKLVPRAETDPKRLLIHPKTCEKRREF